VWLANDPGVASITWHGWRVDTTAAMVLLAVIITVLLILAVVRIIAMFTGTIRAMASARRERRLKRGLTALGDGFAAVQAGNAAAAQKLAREAATLLSDNVAVMVLKKEAAELSGQANDTRAAAEALLSRPETEVSALRTLAGQSLDQGDTVGALTHAKRAMSRKDAPAWALKMVLDVEIAGARWGDALSALDSKAGREVFPPAEHRRLKARLMARQAEDLLTRGESSAASAMAHRAMQTDMHPAAVLAYAKAMTAQGKGKKAAGDIESAWAKAPHADLLLAYRVLVPAEPALEWARRVERLVKTNSDHPESRLALAEASLWAELWGQVRNRLNGLTADTVEHSVRARAAQLMAAVETGERGDAEAAAKWLRLAVTADDNVARSAVAPKSAAEILAEA